MKAEFLEIVKRTEGDQLSQSMLIELARACHVYENEEDDINMLRITDEVNRRGASQVFQQLYMQVWSEFV